MLEFNQSPYFDDYNEKKNFYKILFRPERPVQARELTTLQTMFNRQVRRFADHMFKNGTKISDARTRILEYNYILIATATSTAALKEGMLLVGTISGQQATFIDRVDDKMCLEFRGSNITNTGMGFTGGEPVDALYPDGTLAITFDILNTPVYAGKIHIFTIEKGVFYFNGYFIENKRQIMPITLQDDIEIGFQVVEKIVTLYDDISLLDNNSSTMAHLQPGADRYKVDLVLTVRSTSAEQISGVQNLYDTSKGFITLASIRNGAVAYILSETEYGALGDYIATRTYEEAGNFTVRPFPLKLIEHLSTSETDELGFDVNGNEANYVAQLGPSVAYVRGFRSETLGPTNIVVNKSRDTNKSLGGSKQFEDRTYILATPRDSTSSYPNGITGNLISDNSVILLYDGVLNLSNQPTGNIIGSLKVSDMRFHATVATKKVYKYFIHGISLNAGKKFSDIKALYHAAATFAADPQIDAATGDVLVYRAGNQESIWEIEKPYLKSIRSIQNSDSGSITATVRKKLTAVLDSAGSTSFTAPTGEFFKPFNDSTIAISTNGGVSSVITTLAATSVNEPDKLTVNLGPSYSGRTLTLITDILITNQAEKTKKTETQRDSFGTSTATALTLTKSDVLSFKVYTYVKAVSTNPNILDVTEHFTMFNGCTDTHYVNATITRTSALPGAVNTALHGLRVEYTYYSHSGTEGYFTVDSYVDTIYKNIPTYKTTAGREYRLANSFDFRPLVLGQVTLATGIAGTPALVGSSSYPTINDLAIFDTENYLSRIDCVAIRKDGGILVYKGKSAETPVLPELEEDHMVLYNLYLPPYLFKMSDIVVKFVENRRYTMRDIGVIEKRLKSIEYYTSLTLLEKKAKDFSVKDVNGLDRFKNGFVVDDFGNFQAADQASVEFRAAIDPGRSELRPSFQSRNFKLKFQEDKSLGGVLREGVAYLNWSDTLGFSQPYATKSLSINPYFMTVKKGVMVLTPNVDTWADTKTAPEVVLKIDTGTTQLLDQMGHANGFGKTLGDWTEVNRTKIAPDDISSVTIPATPPVVVQPATSGGGTLGASAGTSTSAPAGTAVTGTGGAVSTSKPSTPGRLISDPKPIPGMPAPGLWNNAPDPVYLGVDSGRDHWNRDCNVIQVTDATLVTDAPPDRIWRKRDTSGWSSMGLLSSGGGGGGGTVYVNPNFTQDKRFWESAIQVGTDPFESTHVIFGPKGPPSVLVESDLVYPDPYDLDPRNGVDKKGRRAARIADCVKEQHPPQGKVWVEYQKPGEAVHAKAWEMLAWQGDTEVEIRGKRYPVSDPGHRTDNPDLPYKMWTYATQHYAPGGYTWKTADGATHTLIEEKSFRPGWEV